MYTIQLHTLNLSEESSAWLSNNSHLFKFREFENQFINHTVVSDFTGVGFSHDNETDTISCVSSE